MFSVFSEEFYLIFVNGSYGAPVNMGFYLKKTYCGQIGEKILLEKPHTSYLSIANVNLRFRIQDIQDPVDNISTTDRYSEPCQMSKMDLIVNCLKYSERY